ncbi:DNA-binding protein [Salmonella enterica]|nr:DNA-binding protein [Salmonella enterica]ECA8898437.1 DNA-binding protein [Salmonella enterica subsp. enterica serovar Cubana]ECS4106680.1 DNA-binding protein [Salmonella enterica subsp. enterica serovar Cubana]ECU6685239.1 DNA-binding protein [Salmonella enterica subsp. enterica serovar Cubana]EGS3073492.1 DNA-binding protein [Salmonella enterica]
MSNIIPINFEGHSMRFYDDGWIDATTAAEKFDKVPNEFLRLPETESYIQGLERRYGKIPYVKTSRARKDRGGGTWLHPKLAVRFARWLSVDFEIWCDEQVHAIINDSAHHIDDDRIKAIFLLNDPSSWEKRFNDPLYDALFKMTGLPRHRPNRKPMIFSLISANWIYKPVLPPDVYAEVKARLRKREKIHQHLKPDALTIVERQIIAVTSIANGCSDYRDFEARCMAAFPVKGQMKLLYAAA